MYVSASQTDAKDFKLMGKALSADDKADAIALLQVLVATPFTKMNGGLVMLRIKPGNRKLTVPCPQQSEMRAPSRWTWSPLTRR